MHALEGHGAEGRLRQRFGRSRCADLGSRGQQLQKTLGGAGRLRQLAPHLGEFGHGTGRKHRVENELAEPPAGHLAADDQPRAEPQHADHAGHHEKDGDRGQTRTGEQTVARRRKSAFHGLGKPPRHGPLLAEGSHGTHGAEIVGRVGRCVGKPVLRRARQPLHSPAVGQQRKNDGRNGRKCQGGERRARHEHHDERAGEHDRVTQRLAQCRAGRTLDLGGVGGEAAHHLARVGGLVERRTERGQMAKHLRPQVRHHPFAQPVDRVHARGACHRQHQADDDQHGKIHIHEYAVGARKAVIDHAAHGDRHRQHGAGRDHERDQRHRKHARMAQDVWP